jgi:hypothetical protein
MTLRIVGPWVALAALGVALSACASAGSRAGTGSAFMPPPPGQGVAPAAQADAAPPPPADPWPRDVTLGNADALIYQPQVNSWKGNELSWRVAVALRPSGARDETFGVLSGTARTEVDRTTRTVALEDITVGEIKFPTLPDNGADYLSELRRVLPGALDTMALDSLEASLQASQTVKPTGLPVMNDPPRIVISYGPALLVPIDGVPVLRPVPDTRFERVINTQAMIARTRGDGAYYLHVYDGWLSSASLAGPWTKPEHVPFDLDDVAKKLAELGTVDLLDGSPNATPKPSLAGAIPAIYVTEAPTELIDFKGQPNLVPVTGTSLLWATNSATDVLVDTSTNDYYVLLSGRWYRAPGLSGPWSFVAANALPAAFKQIPPKGIPASVVLASVAGTPQAEEAVIANSIPQSASVSRIDGPTFTPVFDGAPVYRPIPGLRQHRLGGPGAAGA